MKKLDRIVQEQIQRAVREELGRIKTPETVRSVAVGVSDLSSQVTAPTLMWKKETYDYPLEYNPSPLNAYASLNYEIIVNRNTTIEAGQAQGGIVTYVGPETIISGTSVRGATQVLRTRIQTDSERVFSTRLIGNIASFGGGKDPVESGYLIIPAIKSEVSTGRYPNWQPLQFIQGVNSTTFDRPMNVVLPAGEWVHLALYIYIGWPFKVWIREAFKGIVYHFDAWKFADKTPPAPPAWGPVPLQSDYLDEAAGTSKNILTIDTPDEQDWLGVGIYRATQQTRTDIIPSPVSSNELLFATSAPNLNLGRAYRWSIYGDTVEPYVFVRKAPYQKNLLSNGGFAYDSADWRFQIDGPNASDNIRMVKYEPWSPPNCMKSSAAYSAASKFDMVIQSSSFPIDNMRGYNISWYVKTQDGTSSSKPVSAIQINYYSDDSHTLCVATPYQIARVQYNEVFNRWQRHDRYVYGMDNQAALNPGLVTGASALSDFVFPADCQYADIKFKMSHNHSARAVYYFDGACVQLDSGQPFVYNAYATGGVVGVSRYNLTSAEDTAYSIIRLPLRGREDEVLSGHTSLAYGEDIYRSSAHWSKFAHGIEIGDRAINRIKNGGFLGWGGTGLNQVPTDWTKFNIGSDPIPLSYPASTAVYGGTSCALYWGTVDAGGSGMWQNWGASNKKRVAYSFWLYLDTGAIKIGDLNQEGVITYKQPSSYWYTIYSNGYNDSGPPHTDNNEYIVPKRQWKYCTMFLASSYGLHFWSNVKGTLAYIDGVQANYNPQSNGGVYPITSMFDPIRMLSGATARPASYVHASANSINMDTHTIRCWFAPAHDWYMHSTTTGTIGEHIPKPVVWYLGQPLALLNDYQVLYYRPFVVESSAVAKGKYQAGGFFEVYTRKWTGSITCEWLVPGAPVPFSAFEPVHLVFTWAGGLENTQEERSRHTKLYVNGIMTCSSNVRAVYDNTFFYRGALGVAMDPTDNIVLGAVRGYETSTSATLNFANVNIEDTAIGHANGVISEFRVDNYIWSEEQVQEDYMATRPRIAPEAAASWTTYEHLVDRLRDGSEKQYITWVDAGVTSGDVYSYALDAFDYFNNRSILGDTASITAGDTIAPGPVTDTGYAINKETHVTYYWVNPSDTDFAATRVYNSESPYETYAIVEGEPSGRSTWSAGFLGYGAVKTVILRTIDDRGNEDAGSDIAVTAITKKGPLRRIDGTIMFNRVGLIDGEEPYTRDTGISWAQVYFTTTNPDIPLYKDLSITLYPRYSDVYASAYPTPIMAPVKMGSAGGFTQDSAYYLYLTDSAGDSRPNAKMFAFAQTLSSADSLTAYPLGRWWTGNATVKGYFTPDMDAGHTISGDVVTFGRVQDRTGRNYFDLQRGVLHMAGERGNYLELDRTQVKYYNVGSDKVYEAPRGIYYIPASLVRVGYDNSFGEWGLGSTLPEIPSVHLQAARAQTYSTDANFGSTKDQYLEMGMAFVTIHTCHPYCRLIAEGTDIETHSVTATRDIYDTTIGSYDLSLYGGEWKVRPFDPGVAGTILPYVYWPLYDALDTSQVGFDSVTRLDFQITIVGSGGYSPFYKQVREKFSIDYDSALGDWGPPMYSVAKNYRDELVVDHGNADDVRFEYNFTKVWSTPAAWKPKVLWWWSWVGPNYPGESEPAGQVKTGQHSSRRIWLSKVTYYNNTGDIIEQTGTGVVDAIVVI